MWIYVALVVVWLLVAVLLGRRDRGREVTLASVEQQQRSLVALEDATRRASGDRARRRVAPRPAPRTGITPVRVGWRPRRRTVAFLAATALLVAAGVAVAATGTIRTEEPGRDARVATTRAPAPDAAASSPAPPAPAAAPAPQVVDAGGSTDVVVRVPAPTFTIRVTAREASWVGILEPAGADPGGSTLAPGETREIPASGLLVVRFGNPGGVDMVVDGQPIVFATESGMPRTVRFEGGA